MGIALEVPDGQNALESTLQVSRTWRPASYGGTDLRQLGVGVTVHYVGPDELTESGLRTVRPPKCLL